MSVHRVDNCFWKSKRRFEQVCSECKGYAGSHVQLCYGLEPPKAQFAVCHNKETLTPDFTGHIVLPDIEGKGREDDWREDKGKFGNESYFQLIFLCQSRNPYY